MIYESGEDYLYDADYFATLTVPKTVETMLRRIRRRKRVA